MKVRTIKFIDRFIGSLLCLFFSVFKIFKKKAKDKPNNVLVIQLWGIGETILTLPAVDALKKEYQNISILVTSRNKDVYESADSYELINLNLNPFSILEFTWKYYNKFDIVIDMEEYLNISALISFFVGKRSIGYSHGIRSLLYTQKINYNDQQHCVQTFLDLSRSLGIKYNVVKLPKLNVDEKDKAIVDKTLKKSNIIQFICIAPGAAESAKCRMWPGSKYAQLADKLIKRFKTKIVFIGSSYESGLIEGIQSLMKEKDKSINLAGEFTLKQVFYLISLSKMMISNDAGSMHIAAAQGVKTIGLFGPNLPVRFGPFGKGNLSIYKGKACSFSPCINVHKGQLPDCLYPRHSDDYQKCMKAIEVEDVMKVI